MQEQELKKISGKLIEIDSKLDKDTFHISGGEGNISQLNQFIVTNDFEVEFYYDEKMINLLNFENVYHCICDYLKIDSNKNLKITIQSPKLCEEIARDIKIDIINIINSLKKNENITRSYLSTKLNGLFLHNTFFMHLDRILSNQEQMQNIFIEELNKEILEFEDINDLAEKYPNVEFYGYDSMVNEPSDFIDLQKQKLINLENDNLVKNKDYIKLLLINWGQIRFKLAAKYLYI